MLIERVGRGWVSWKKAHFFAQMLSTTFAFIGEIVALSRSGVRAYSISRTSLMAPLGRCRFCPLCPRLCDSLRVSTSSTSQFLHLSQRSMVSGMEEAKSHRRLFYLRARLLSILDGAAIARRRRQGLPTLLRVHILCHRILIERSILRGRKICDIGSHAVYPAKLRSYEAASHDGSREESNGRTANRLYQILHRQDRVEESDRPNPFVHRVNDRVHSR